jgi:protein involved in ribonucleotide reduction
MRQTPIYYYSSSSGLVRTFAEHLGRPVFNLAEREHRLSEADGPWVLLTPSYKSGNDRNDTVPEGVLRFLASDVNRRRMVGVIGSGNRNFGVHYQRACRVVAARSGRPVLFEFELSGTPWDVEECRRIMAELDEALAAHDETPHDETPHDETPHDETPAGRPVD